jgi:hypothetical protein
MSSDLEFLVYMQQEIATVTTDVARLYNERVIKENRTAKDCMQEVVQVIVKFLRNDFDKLASVANSKHRPQFIEVVSSIPSIIL